MKCENGPTHVLAFFGSKIENDLSVGGWTFGSLLGDEVDQLEIALQWPHMCGTIGDVVMDIFRTQKRTDISRIGMKE